MNMDEQNVGVFEDYLGFSVKKFVTFTILVVGVIIAVTGIYVAIFGLDTWKSSMQQAGSMMLANFNAPGTQQAVTPCPPGLTPAAATTVPVPPAQYACPNCGTTALPTWNATGTPVCPNCGSVMSVSGQPNPGLGGRLAAAP